MNQPKKCIIFVPFYEGVTETAPISDVRLQFLLALFRKLATYMTGYVQSNTRILAPMRAGQGTQCGDVEIIAGLLHLDNPKYLPQLLYANISFEATSEIITGEHTGYYTIVFINVYHSAPLAKYLYEERLSGAYELITEQIEGANVSILQYKG